jgi:O-antigen ligase
MSVQASAIFRPAGRSSCVREEGETGVRLARFLYYGGLLSVGQMIIRPAFSLTLSDYFFFAALAAAFPSLFSQRLGDGYLPRGVLCGSYLFCLGALLSTFASPQPLRSLGVLVRFEYLTLVWLWLGTVVLRRPDQVRTAVACWVVSLVINGAAAVAQLVWGDVIPGATVVCGRMTGFGQHVNDLGGSEAVGLIAAVWLATSSARSIPVPFAGIATVALVGAGIVLSGSVGGLIAATVAAATYLALSRPSLRVILLAAAIAAAALAAIQLQIREGAPTPLERIQQVRQEGGSMSSRLDTYRSVIPRIEHNPVIGVGMGAGVEMDTIQSDGTTHAVIHSQLLGVWYEGGLLALLGLLLVIASLIVTAVDAQRRAVDGRDRLLCAALLACLLAWLAFAMSSPSLYTRYGWVPAALVLAVRAQQRRTNTAPADQMRQGTTRRFRMGDL